MDWAAARNFAAEQTVLEQLCKFRALALNVCVCESVINIFEYLIFDGYSFCIN